MILPFFGVILLCYSTVAATFQLAHTHYPQDFLAQIAGSAHEGQQIVQHFCSSCHAVHPKISLGAPRIGNPDDWSVRVSQGLDILFQHTAQGYNSMPARGGCFECSDKQLKRAILVLIKYK